MKAHEPKRLDAEDWFDRQNPKWVDQCLLERPPLAPSSEVFFLNALVAVGRMRFGDEWQDAERVARRMARPVLTEFIPFPIRKAPDKPESLIRLPGSLASYPDNSSCGESDQQFAERKAAASQAYQEWEQARERVEALNAQAAENHIPRHRAAVAAYEANQKAVARLTAARDILLQAILDGLPVTLRLDGNMKKINQEWLAGTRDNPSLLQRGAVQFQAKLWTVFVERGALERTFPTTLQAPITEVESIYLSPEMQLAVDVIREWNITSDNRPSVDAIASRITALAADRAIPMSPRRAKEIARVARGQ